jgi:2-methylaconitate cis-trans-isomerase PrpF
VPKVALIAPGEDVAVRVVSMGKFHKAVALTAAMCLAVAAHVPGTLVREAAGEIAGGQDVRIAHPAGVLPIAAEVRDGRAERVVVYRTARRLMEGAVLVPERVLSDPEPFADRLASRPAVLAE